LEEGRSRDQEDEAKKLKKIFHLGGGGGIDLSNIYDSIPIYTEKRKGRKETLTALERKTKENSRTTHQIVWGQKGTKHRGEKSARDR